MIGKSCAFTGHRPKSFPWRYNEMDARCVALKETLARQIARLAERGITEYLSGMAEAVDTWAALSVLAFCPCLARKKSRASAPLYSALQIAGGQVEYSSEGVISLHIGSVRFHRMGKPGIHPKLYAGTQSVFSFPRRYPSGGL